METYRGGRVRAPVCDDRGLRVKKMEGEEGWDGDEKSAGTLRAGYTSFNDAFLFSKQTHERSGGRSLR